MIGKTNKSEIVNFEKETKMDYKRRKKRQRENIYIYKKETKRKESSEKGAKKERQLRKR